jgi:hypothetical protein
VAAAAHYLRLTTQILSRTAFDGDIRFIPPIFHSHIGNIASVFAGIDPAEGSEFRAFLNFPLTGAGGFPGVANINSATLDIFINNFSIQPAASSIPSRIELVSFPPQILLASDYDRNIQTPLAITTIIPPISRADVLRHITEDVTSLIVEAQRRGLAYFQIRILEDDGFVFSGRIEIDDTTINRAPLLTVTYI